MSIRRLVLSLLTVGALAVPSSALAQDTSPLVQSYSSTGPSVENQVTPPGQVEAQVVSAPKKQTAPAPAATAPTAAAQPQETAKGSLPFTGLDARLLAIAGVVLAGIGFATRKLAQRMD